MEQTLIPWIQILSDFGFPALMSIYLLIRFEKIISELTNEVRSLTKEVRKVLEVKKD